MFKLETLGGKSLNGGHAAEVVVQTVGHRGCRFAGSAIARRKSLLKPESTDQNQRNRQKGQGGEVGGEQKEHAADQQGGDKHLDQIIRASIQKALDLMDIFVQYRQQPTAARLRNEIRWQPLQVGIGRAAQLMLQILGEAAPAQGIEILEAAFQHPDDNGQAGQHQQLMQRVGQAEAGEKAVLPVNHHIDRHADQDLRQDVEHLVQHRVQAAGPDFAAMRAGVAQQAR